MRRSAATLVLASIAVVSCGDRTAPTRVSSEPSASPPVLEESGKPGAPAAVRVIRSWAEAERASDLARASSYFAIPSVVSNGAGLERLVSNADARRFNAALPCGARLLRASAAPRGSYTIATFRLVSRPGARCDGSGAQARTAFDIRAGKIRAWIRLPDPPAGRPPSPGAPAPGPGDRLPGDGPQSV